MTKQKGQIESFVFTILFLVIAVIVVIAGVVTLIASRGNQLERSGELLGGTTRPMSFSEGLILLSDGASSPLEESLRISVIGRLPAAYPSAERLPFATVLQRAIEAAGLKDNWQFGIFNGVAYTDIPVLQLGTYPNFCGSDEKFAWCQDARVTCAPGWTDFSQGQSRCTQQQKCCQPIYNFSEKRFTSQFVDTGAILCGSDASGVCRSSCSQNEVLLSSITTCPGSSKCCQRQPPQANIQPLLEDCGPDVDGWNGLCRDACLQGETRIEPPKVADDCSTTTHIFVGGGGGYTTTTKKTCCRPTDRIQTIQTGTLNNIAIPLLYADEHRSVTGRIELWIGEPKVKYG